jgi:DNA polymerase-3 subunit gamma/tau
VYQVLARKWRPKKFNDVIGQEHITKTLVNSIEKNKVAHAYLFTGTRGVGKTTIARIFAKSLRCENRLEDFNPCGECNSCKSIDSSNSLDYVEIDGASNNSVDNIRELIENVNYLPSSGKYKVYVIDEVHMLSNSAFNALLKTLEEPPAHVVFIFATTDPHKLLGTVLSRCQRFDFKVCK